MPIVGAVLTALRRDLTAAMKARDSVSVSALRSALAAIENAGAVDSSPDPSRATESAHFAGSVSGLGNAEVQRRVLGEGEMERLVGAEVEERQSVARDLELAGRHERAARLLAEAEILLRYLPR
jgi:uncharacterized protein